MSSSKTFTHDNEKSHMMIPTDINQSLDESFISNNDNDVT